MHQYSVSLISSISFLFILIYWIWSSLACSWNVHVKWHIVWYGWFPHVWPVILDCWFCRIFFLDTCSWATALLVYIVCTWRKRIYQALEHVITDFWELKFFLVRKVLFVKEDEVRGEHYYYFFLRRKLEYFEEHKRGATYIKNSYISYKISTRPLRFLLECSG